MTIYYSQEALQLARQRKRYTGTNGSNGIYGSGINLQRQFAGSPETGTGRLLRGK